MKHVFSGAHVMVCLSLFVMLLLWTPSEFEKNPVQRAETSFKIQHGDGGGGRRVALVVMAGGIAFVYIPDMCINIQGSSVQDNNRSTHPPHKSAQMCDLRLYFCSKTCHLPIKNSKLF